MHLLMANKRNLYRLLQVQPDAPEEIIRVSYRTLMQKLRMHPDLGGDSCNAALVNHAYEVLCDKQKRAAYDRQLKTRLHNLRYQATGTSIPAGQNTGRAPTSRCPFCNAAQPRLNRNAPDRVCISCRSPLQFSAKKSLTGHGKRSIFRIPQNARINIVTSWPQTRIYQASIDDLSPNGLQLRSRLEIMPEHRLKLFNDNLQAIGKVVRCDPGIVVGVYCIGIEFVTLYLENNTGSFFSERT